MVAPLYKPKGSTKLLKKMFLGKRQARHNEFSNHSLKDKVRLDGGDHTTNTNHAVWCQHLVRIRHQAREVVAGLHSDTKKHG